MQPTLFKTQVSCLRRKFFLRFYVILILDYCAKEMARCRLRLWMTAQNCLKAADQVNFQLVFMDIYMENMDGMGMPNLKKQSNPFNSIA